MQAGFRKVVAWIFATLGIGPIVAEVLKRWLDKQGWLDNPGQGVDWLLTSIGSVTEWWGFYYLVTFAAGLLVGLWIDLLAKRSEQSVINGMQALGYEMTGTAERILKPIQSSLHEWPESIADDVPRIQSLMIRIRKAGLWAPDGRVLDLNDNGNLLVSYLKFVGQMLCDGHFSAALDHAMRAKAHFEQELAALADMGANSFEQQLAALTNAGANSNAIGPYSRRLHHG